VKASIHNQKQAADSSHEQDVAPRDDFATVWISSGYLRPPETSCNAADRATSQVEFGTASPQNTETGLAAGFAPAYRRKRGDRYVNSAPEVSGRGSIRGNA
jgi:hypothetical protein